jgi:hypothetical protein
MNKIKCACGNAGCTTEIYVHSNSLSSVDLVIEYQDNNKKDWKYTRVSLDPNRVVQLIKELKQALMEMS